MKTTVLDYVGSSHNSDGKECINHYYHRNALNRTYQHPFGSALRAMLEGWERYASAFRDRYGETVSTDGLLGDHWFAVGEGLRCLLDGETGGWDCGSLNHNIIRIMGENGFPRKDLGYKAEG